MTTLGIIKADDVDVELRSRFGDTHGMFQLLFESANTDQLTLRSYDAREYRYPENLDECDGYLITGSRFCAFSDTPWIQRLIDFVRLLDRERKKLIGICFGHQCIALALGGSVVKAPQGWGMGVHEYQLLLSGVLAEVSTPTVRLRCSHEDQVERLPTRATRLLTSEFCKNAGMIVEDHSVSFQAHPEFGVDFTRHLILNREEDLGPNFEPALASLDSEVDSISVARSLVRFLERT
ncbi:MAG: hypothetical protein OXH31_03705 [Gammaproteobacteria bacterium]|nr:hypothetical protein [Gammaproteobacteria bacterium]